MQEQQTQQKRRHFPWIRATVTLLVSLLIAAATLLTIFNMGHIIAGYWYVVVPIIFSALGLLITLGQWLFPISTEPPTQNEQATSVTHTISSSSAQLEQRDRDVLQAIGKAVQAQQEPERATEVTALLPLLQDRYLQQDIVDTLEWFHEMGDIRLHKVFGGTLVSSFHLTPHGKRKLALIR